MIHVKCTPSRSAGREFRTFRVMNSENGLQQIQLIASLGPGQQWDKEFPKIVAAIMALTGVHDPELILINDMSPDSFAAA